MNIAAGGGGGGGNVVITGQTITLMVEDAADGIVGGTPPLDAIQIGFNSAGTFQSVSNTNPLPITGSITATNPSVGLTGSTAPTSATEIGIIVGGNLVGVSSANPIPVSQSGTWNVGLSAGSNVVGGVEIYDASGVNKLAVNASGQIAISNFPASSGNAAASATGSGVPTSADYVGLNVGGTLRGQTGVNPSGVVYAAQEDITSVGGATIVTAATGVLKVGIVGNAGGVFDAALNAATPANAILIAGSDGTNLRVVGVGSNNAMAVQGLTTSGSSSLQALSVQGVSGGFALPISGTVSISGTSSVSQGTSPWIVAGGGTAGSSGTAVLTVQGISGGTAVPISGTVALTTGGIVNIRSTATASNPADNQLTSVFLQNSASSGVAPLYVADSVYGGAFSGAADATRQGWSKMRAPTVFKTVQATATGNTAVWTPGSGNKFRLLKVFIELTDNASLSAGAVLTISFQDGTTAMPIAVDVFVPTTAVTTVVGVGIEQLLDLGPFGIQSAAANNVLNVNLSAVLATGNVRVIAMGTEE